MAPSAWWAEDERDLMTALDALGREREQQHKARPDGRVTSG